MTYKFKMNGYDITLQDVLDLEDKEIIILLRTKQIDVFDFSGENTNDILTIEEVK
jgi:hypothetical protein